MSIYDVAEHLLKIYHDSILSEDQVQVYEKLLLMIDDDDSYPAERFRSLLQNYINAFDVAFECSSESEETEEQAATEVIVKDIDYWAQIIFKTYEYQIEVYPDLKSIKNVTYEYLQDHMEKHYLTQADLVAIAHRVFDIYHNND